MGCTSSTGSPSTPNDLKLTINDVKQSAHVDALKERQAHEQANGAAGTVPGAAPASPSPAGFLRRLSTRRGINAPRIDDIKLTIDDANTGAAQEAVNGALEAWEAEALAVFDDNGSQDVAAHPGSIQIPVLEWLLSKAKSRQLDLGDIETERAAAKKQEAAAKKAEDWDAAIEARESSAALDIRAAELALAFTAERVLEQASLVARLTKSRQWLQALHAKAAPIEARQAAMQAEIAARESARAAGVEARELALARKASEAEAARQARMEALGAKKTALLAKEDYSGLKGVAVELAAVQGECDAAKAEIDHRHAEAAALATALAHAQQPMERDAAMEAVDKELEPLRRMVDLLEFCKICPEGNRSCHGQDSWDDAPLQCPFKHGEVHCGI
jgi:hypothetical protein